MDSRRPTPISTTVPDWQRANWPMLNELLEVRLQAVQAKEDLFTAWDEWKTILFEELEKRRKAQLGWPKTVGSGRSAVALEAQRSFGNTSTPNRRCQSTRQVFPRKDKFSPSHVQLQADSLPPLKKNFSPASLDFPILHRAPVQEPKLNQWRISVGDGENQLKALDIKSATTATGPDGIPAVLLKNCASTLCPSLAHIFQLSILASVLPMDWKNAAVTPVPKEGEKTNFKNYRPISVIQGSCLGPLLFNLFAADLPAVVNTNLVQYADDCTVFNNIKSDDDIDALQDDLARIDIWCLNNGMQLNAKKCVVMAVTRARLPCNLRYTIGGVTLQYEATQRLLGVHLSRDLRWNHLVDVQRKKALQTLGFAARNLRGCTLRVKRIAYLSLVKPKLFYGSPAWHPSTKTNTEKMIRVQNRALHFIHGRRIPPPIQQNFLSVPAQLVYNDLLFFKKCLAGVTDYDAMARITQGRVHRGDDPLHPRLQQPPARTDLGKNVFDFRVVKEWNDMPPALKDCSATQFPSTCKAGQPFQCLASRLLRDLALIESTKPTLMRRANWREEANWGGAQNDFSQ
ncbi:Hypothetical predicted protein [Cloeon dipterum]|uniref:Reverse transcriptase domain-containing protein n=1 Tax=Cloeon dipterum TaxID=197152 RepID=A0A8S1DYF4_9INSE|nr:Hypothetical predicted protein [Cloeon dipterum]